MAGKCLTSNYFHVLQLFTKMPDKHHFARVRLVRGGPKVGQIVGQNGKIRNFSDQISAKMYWNLIWKSPGFFPIWGQSDPLWAQIWHPLWASRQGMPTQWPSGPRTVTLHELCPWLSLLRLFRYEVDCWHSQTIRLSEWTTLQIWTATATCFTAVVRKLSGSHSLPKPAQSRYAFVLIHQIRRQT